MSICIGEHCSDEITSGPAPGDDAYKDAYGGENATPADEDDAEDDLDEEDEDDAEDDLDEEDEDDAEDD